MGDRLVTARLILRPAAEGDYPALHHLVNEPGVRRYLWDGHPVSLEQVRAAVAGSIRFWVEVLPPGEAPVGFCLFRPHVGSEEIEIVYALAMRLWGQGLTTEAAGAALAEAFENMPWPYVIACAHPRNVASWRVLERLGFTWEGLDGYSEEPVRRYRLTAAQWQEPYFRIANSAL